MSNVLYPVSVTILIVLVAYLYLLLRMRTRELEMERRHGDRTRTFHTLFNITRGGLALIDSSGNFRDVNPSCSSLFGYQRDELLAMNISAINGNPHKLHSGTLGLIDEYGSGFQFL